jgi:hypothetical protein
MALRNCGSDRRAHSEQRTISTPFAASIPPAVVPVAIMIEPMIANHPHDRERRLSDRISLTRRMLARSSGG